MVNGEPQSIQQLAIQYYKTEKDFRVWYTIKIFFIVSNNGTAKLRFIVRLFMADEISSRINIKFFFYFNNIFFGFLTFTMRVTTTFRMD